MIICHRLSQLKEGMGILLPTFVPAMMAALLGLILALGNPAAVAFF
jgi:uncharacterized membrane protein